MAPERPSDSLNSALATPYSTMVVSPANNPSVEVHKPKRSEPVNLCFSLRFYCI